MTGLGKVGKGIGKGRTKKLFVITSKILPSQLSDDLP